LFVLVKNLFFDDFENAILFRSTKKSVRKCYVRLSCVGIVSLYILFSESGYSLLFLYCQICSLSLFKKKRIFFHFPFNSSFGCAVLIEYQREEPDRQVQKENSKMALSIFTNASSMASVNALNKSNSMLSTAMERLGTGKRINSAADDAAGLQIATRLQGQTNGMAVAQRNISDATALMQTAEGAFDEVSNIMYRMKDLATQASNDTNSKKDREAIDSELNSLNDELRNIMGNTSYAGEKLFGASGKFANDLNFQIGTTSGESLVVKMSDKLNGATGAVNNASGGFSELETGSYWNGASGLITLADDDSQTSVDNAKALIDNLNTALDSVGSVRSSFGATINRLGHTAANLANMKDNTDLALGNIRDADFASEASSMTRNQMLAQTSMSMLKQSNSMSGMVMSLLG